MVGVDVTPPRHDIGQAALRPGRHPQPGDRQGDRRRAVDTVVHMAMVATPGSAGGRSSMKEINVIGTMQLLAACQKAASFTKLVVQSSVSVYGASPRDPAKFTEEMSPAGPAAHRLRQGLGRDRELCAWARTAPARCRGHHPAAGEPDGRRSGQPRHPVPVDACGAPGDGFRRRACSSCTRPTPSRPCCRPPGTSAGTFNVAALDVVTLTQACANSAGPPSAFLAAGRAGGGRAGPAGPVDGLLHRPDRRV